MAELVGEAAVAEPVAELVGEPVGTWIALGGPLQPFMCTTYPSGLAHVQ